MVHHQATLDRGWRVHQAGDVRAAEAIYRSVLDQSPGDANALVYLGIAQFDQRDFLQSAESYRQALAIRDAFPVAWNNLGNTLRMLGQIDEAESCFATALRQQPGYLSALKNRGTLWIWSGEIRRGLEWYQQGLELRPDDAELHRNLGVIHLLLGNYDVGWPHYRWRWRMPGLRRPPNPAPLWQGQALSGKTILVYPEQGRGDAIQFVRVTSLLAELGARVVLQVAPEMLALFSSAPAYDRLVSETVSAGPVDFQASFLEVIDVYYQQTGQLDYRPELFSAGEGYLRVSDPLVQYWQRWLDENVSGRRIGINWQGNPDHHADIYRSIPLSALRPLADLPDVNLINLQFGFGSEQLADCEFADRVRRLPDHVDQSDGAFTDTVAILKSLDRVVTTDTAVAHLAGAVGTPVTLLLGRVPDWRWLTEGDSTPWYPSMEIIRQTTIGCWEEVVKQAAERIAAQ